jgi:hypothetical protein
MKPPQFHAIYNHLLTDARHLSNHKIFDICDLDGITPVDAILYLPLYSLGIAAHGMEARIAYLKGKASGRDLEYFTQSPLEILEDICRECYSEGKLFGDFFIRLYEIRHRAKAIVQLTVERVEQQLTPPKEFPEENTFKNVLAFLMKFRGVSDKAAQHILMDLGWPIVKPDRHIQRILYRMGGWNDFFDSEEGNKKFNSQEWYRFQKKWYSIVEDIVTHQYDFHEESLLLGVPSLNDFNSRKVDICLMWFSQTQRREDETLMPPVCTSDPKCQRCAVPGCQQRRRETTA